MEGADSSRDEMVWWTDREMDLPSVPGARHLAEQKAQRGRLLLGASALRTLLFQRVPGALQELRRWNVLSLFVCAKWGAAREIIGQTVGAKLTPETMVWTDLDAHRVIRHTSDEDERARWAQGTKQWGRPVEIASGLTPTVAFPGRTGLSRRWGEGPFPSPSWRGWSVKPNGQVAVGAGSGWMDDDNQPPVKFKAERRFCGRCIDSKEGVFGFNSYA